MKATKGDKIKVAYAGKLTDGTLFDQSAPDRPLEFTLGEGKLIPGFEQAVEGMGIGEVKTVDIAVQQAYGEHDATLIRKFSRAVLSGDMQLEKGRIIRLRLANGGGLTGMVLAVTGEDVIVDLNHPLAGKDLRFEITVVSIERPGMDA
jgi:peptidylprolyl isomerase